jgi:phage-related protein
MKMERTVSAYKNYFVDFISSLKEEEAMKVYYVIDMLKGQKRVNTKFVKYLRDELYEIRAMYDGNIFRVFFIFDDGNIVILFNGFQKKTRKTPRAEIEKALKLKEEYYGSKK